MTVQIHEDMARQIEIGGQRIHYRVLGDPLAPPVIMLHGIMGHSREWDGVVEAMSRTGRVFVIDQRGHGRSDWAEDYSLDAMTRDIIGFIETLALTPARIVGHSMGGMVAMTLAAARPELVERVVVVDIAPDSVTGELAAGLREFVTGLASRGYDTVDDAYAEWAGDPYARPELLRHYVEHALRRGADGKLAWRFDGVGLEGFLDSVDPGRLWRAVDSIRVPVLVVRGEHSEAVSMASALQMLGRFCNARLVEIPDGAHDLGVQQPEAVAEAVLEFFAD